MLFRNSEDAHGSTAYAERVTGSSTSGGSLETAYSISESDPNTPKYEHAGPAVAPESYPSSVIGGEYSINGFCKEDTKEYDAVPSPLHII